MMNGSVPIWIACGLIALGVAGWLVFHSRETRVERRRRKSHNRVVTKTSRPMVKFSVRPPKEK